MAGDQCITEHVGSDEISSNYDAALLSAEHILLGAGVLAGEPIRPSNDRRLEKPTADRRNLRKHPRYGLGSPVSVSWEERPGMYQYTQGRCLDISDEGLRMELSMPIGVRSCVNVQVTDLGFVGSASVRYCSRASSKYVLGVEFLSSWKLFTDEREKLLFSKLTCL